MQNVLTIDVEEHFQVAALAEKISVDDWETIPSRVEANTSRLLDLFDEYDLKVTHFVLGWVAERYPELVRQIHARGHEVASHGYSHQLIYEQTPKVFEQETISSKKILEDIIGEDVNGYRAASYSITRNSLWALDVIAEAGFQYDSSIFPILHDRYGIVDSPTEPHVLKTPKGHSLVEYPLSTTQLLGQTLPIAGGGYFRLYPYWLSRMLYRSRVKQNKPFVFYLHPWEIDPEQPKVDVKWFSRFRHYNKLDQCESRLKKLLSEFSFGTMHEYLTEIGLFNNNNPVAIDYRS